MVSHSISHEWWPSLIATCWPHIARQFLGRGRRKKIIVYVHVCVDSFERRFYKISVPCSRKLDTSPSSSPDLFPQLLSHTILMNGLMPPKEHLNFIAFGFLKVENGKTTLSHFTQATKNCCKVSMRNIYPYTYMQRCYFRFFIFLQSTTAVTINNIILRNYT